MGLFSFGKKKDEPLDLSKLDLGGQPGLNTGIQDPLATASTPQGTYPSGFQTGIPQPTAFQQQAAFQYGGGMDPTYMLQKQMEVLSAKLDSIQMMLQNLNQRLSNLEMIMKERRW
ncbi:MAG: hypothetical protein QXW00_00580 [Candidatus Woesearchaeota archaeon]